MSERKRRQAQQRQSSSSLYERYKDALRRGHVAALRGRLEPAIEAYSEAASIATDRALPHAAIGGILVRMGRIPEALEAYDRALALATRDETALRGRAEALRSLGRRMEAAETLDRLAEVLDRQGKVPDACDAARRALELAESKERRRYVEALADRLREMPADEAAQRSLTLVMRFLQPAAPPPPSDARDDAALADEDVVAEAIAVEESAPEAEQERDAEQEPEPTPEPEPEPLPEPEPEPEPDGVLLAAAAEEALAAGDVTAAREGLLAAAAAYRRNGRSFAAIDSCYLALAIAPADVDLHVMLAEIYLESGWRAPAIDKLLLLGRLAELDEDPATRDRLCVLVRDRLPDEPRLADLCA